ncbi:MAG: hypothetical protein M1416_01330 [Candidatus Pacearchaeota archaeon]|nr:hypothetical protein [Candidatus Pacearchaeota archaeon]
MVASVDQIITTINPDLYYKTSDDKILAKKELAEFKELIRTEGFQKAAAKAKTKSESTHTLIYDSSSETLEPIYFFILDLMNDFGLKPEKLVDNFSSTPGSGHFAELGQRATIMQQQASKIMGDVNTVLRSVLNLVYDLKEFKIRLQSYDGLKSKKPEEKDSAILALKQIWMDKVDIAKGNSSIKGMALGQAGFQTLIDAFLVAKDAKDVKKLDLNDRVKRIVESRVQEFNIWMNESEKELRKRYELEKNYLRSQVNSLKLYARWVKPYLKAATELESKEMGRAPALVKTFNTIMLELTLLGKSKLDIADEALKGNIPADFAKPKYFSKVKRQYYSCILVDFSFRGIPQRVSQQAHFAFGGRAEVTFKSYVMNDDELKKFEEELKKSEVDDVMKLVEGTTSASLGPLEEEINSFLEEKSIEKKEEKMKVKDWFEPFTSLFGEGEKKAEKKKDEKKEIIIAPDSWMEKNYFRKLAAENAVSKMFDLFDIYKKGHGMESYT